MRMTTMVTDDNDSNCIMSCEPRTNQSVVQSRWSDTPATGIPVQCVSMHTFPIPDLARSYASDTAYPYVDSNRKICVKIAKDVCSTTLQHFDKLHVLPVKDNCDSSTHLSTVENTNRSSSIPWKTMPRSLRERFSKSMRATTTTTSVARKYAFLESQGYVVGETLGTGAYAKVKRVWKNGDAGEEFAAKIVSKRKAPSGYMAKFLPREIASMQKLDHHNITKLFDVHEDNDRVYLIMEVATEGDLLEYINSQGPLTEEHTKDIFRQLVTGVQHCHQKGVVHRDLKCENILFGTGRIVKVADFGFARKVPDKNKLLNTHCGSYAYAAPEILLNKPYKGPESDIWSLGIILFAMLVGRLPFNDSDIITLLRQIHRGVSVPRNLSEPCADLLKHMLCSKPTHRITIEKILNSAWLREEVDNDTQAPLPVLLSRCSCNDDAVEGCQGPTIRNDSWHKCATTTKRTTVKKDEGSEVSPHAQVTAHNTAGNKYPPINEPSACWKNKMKWIPGKRLPSLS